MLYSTTILVHRNIKISENDQKPDPYKCWRGLKIDPIEDKTKLPETSFDFTPIEQLHAFLETPTYNPDFVGNYRRQTLASKRNGDPFLLLTLTATGGQEITITIWKECMQNPEKLDTAALSTATADTVVALTNARIIDTNIESCWYIASCPDCKGQISKQKESWFCPNHGQKSIPNFFYNVKVTISDGTANLQAMTTDSCMQSLIGRTCKEIIMEDGYEDRKTLPPSFRKDRMNTYRFYVEMTKKSTPGNINFIIVKKEPLPTQSPSAQPSTPTPKQINIVPTMTESPQTTPPLHIPANPNILNKNDKPAAARQLTFESRGTTDTTEPSLQQASTPVKADTSSKLTPMKTTTAANSEIIEAATDLQNVDTTTDSAETTGKRKPTTTTEKLQNLNPTKRERYPE